MVENNILEDLISRCGAEITVGVLAAANNKFVFIKKFVTELLPLAIDESAKAEGEELVALADGNGDVFGKGIKIKVGNYEANVSFCDTDGEETKSCTLAVCIISGGTTDVAREQIAQKYTCPLVFVPEGDAENVQIASVLKEALFGFPIKSIDIKIPDWIRVMPCDSKAVSEIMTRVREVAEKVSTMRDAALFDDMLKDCNYWKETVQVNLNLAEGRASVETEVKDDILYEMLTEIAGENIADECALMSFVTASSQAKRNYDKVKDALECAKVTGYGIVQPNDDDLSLEKPKLVRQGTNIGINLRGSAPSYHIVRVDVSGEVSPIMGAAGSNEQLVNGIMSGFESDPEGMWDTNLFGKSLRGMVKEGLASKVESIQEDTRNKMRKTITRIINEGKGGVICILL